MSVGVTAIAAVTEDPPALFRATDAAVYEVKRHGRNGGRMVAQAEDRAAHVQAGIVLLGKKKL